jgi:secreted PhoX family phosphatase
MSAPAPERTVLPLLSPDRAHPGGRSAMTCHYRCDDACSKPVPNTSGNGYFGDIVAAGASRRSVLKGGGLAAAVVGLTTFAGAQPAAAVPAAAGGTAPAASTPKSPFGFTPIAAQPEDTDAVVVPDGFTWATIIAWGDPILAGAPAFDFERQSAAAQAGQFGYNNDYVTVIRDGSANEALLVTTHEYTNEQLMFPGIASRQYSALSEEQLRIVMAAHGMSVVELRRRDAAGPWSYVPAAPKNRRITATTAFEVTGPAAGSDLLKTSADPSGTTILGTLNNCAGGTTPWGTVLSGEENFNGYFKAAPTPTAEQRRYGLTGSGRGWERIDARFDLGQEPNEGNRHGWVVQVDPSDPESTPQKLTALGRFKHEGAEVTVADDGRVVVYMGDDERFDYAYKFVSAGTYRPGSSAAARRHNLGLLAEGDLYVARFTGDGVEDGVFDGTGEWIPLVEGGQSTVPGMSLEEVLVFTRLAGDRVGATKMDRPEDFEPHPSNGKVYLANPRAYNKHGHVIELTPSGDHTSRTFAWKIVLVAGDPNDPSTYFEGYDRSEVSSISCPDNVAFDSRGNLWIATDGNALGNCDGMYLYPLQGEHRGHLQQFLSVPTGAENCGPFIVWDDRTVLTAVQHPGEVDGATYDKPASLFPYQGDRGPRPAIIQVHPA